MKYKDRMQKSKTKSGFQLYNKWKRYLDKSKHLGFSHVISCPLDRLLYTILRRIYGFDPWHCEGTWHCRPYKHIAVRMANDTGANTVIEVGCGLGDIISRINAINRIGYDQDNAVITAARKIRGTGLRFKVGSIQDIQENPIDLLIMINWIHEISPKNLQKMMNPMMGRTRMILVDRIHKGTAGYPYHHDFEFLNREFVLRDRTAGGTGEPRELLLYEAKDQ